MGGGVTKNQYIGGDCLRRGGLDSLQNRFKGELGKKERGGIFEGGEGGVNTPMHTMHRKKTNVVVGF